MRLADVRQRSCVYRDRHGGRAALPRTVPPAARCAAGSSSACSKPAPRDFCYFRYFHYVVSVTSVTSRRQARPTTLRGARRRRTSTSPSTHSAASSRSSRARRRATCPTETRSSRGCCRWRAPLRRLQPLPYRNSKLTRLLQECGASSKRRAVTTSRAVAHASFADARGTVLYDRQ